jgi:SAM-dependent methyltransferase
VPLYLSSGEASNALAGLLPLKQGFRLLDLGAGFGGVLADLRVKRPDGHFVGIEIAPLPFAVGWLRGKFSGRNCHLQRGNFWFHDMAPYDVVYAYLSPVPMGDLWRKAAAEMRPGSLLVSNTFPVPGVKPDETLQLADFHRSRLYLYRMRGFNESRA